MHPKNQIYLFLPVITILLRVKLINHWLILDHIVSFIWDKCMYCLLNEQKARNHVLGQLLYQNMAAS